jgi:hypothetical protein
MAFERNELHAGFQPENYVSMISIGNSFQFFIEPNKKRAEARFS